MPLYKGGKKKKWFDISGERTSHVKHVKQTAVFHQYSWKHSAAGGWRHRGIWQAFCLFQSACSVCVSYSTVTLCRKYLHLFTQMCTITSNYTCSITATSPSIKWSEVPESRCLKVTAVFKTASDICWKLPLVEVSQSRFTKISTNSW